MVFSKNYITAVVDYQKIRKIFDQFGSMFFGYVRAMNIAHQGWCYEEARTLCIEKNKEDENGIAYPEEIIFLENGGAKFSYRSRSGKEYFINHRGRNAYYEIEFAYPADSSLAEVIAQIISEN